MQFSRSAYSLIEYENQAIRSEIIYKVTNKILASTFPFMIRQNQVTELVNTMQSISSRRPIQRDTELPQNEELDPR